MRKPLYTGSSILLVRLLSLKFKTEGYDMIKIVRPVPTPGYRPKPVPMPPMPVPIPQLEF